MERMIKTIKISGVGNVRFYEVGLDSKYYKKCKELSIIGIGLKIGREKSIYYAAILDRKIIGVSRLVVGFGKRRFKVSKINFSILKKYKIFELRGLFVRKKYRRRNNVYINKKKNKGVAEELIELRIKHAYKLGADILFVNSRKDSSGIYNRRKDFVNVGSVVHNCRKLNIFLFFNPKKKYNKKLIIKKYLF